MASLAEIVAACDALLAPERFADYCPNGLQVEGRSEVRRIASAVSAHAELFERAIASGVDLLLTHHGLLWGSAPTPLTGAFRQRLKLLLEADISLLAYHLPLDAHPELGNNALIARALGAQSLTPFAEHRGQPIGFIAQLPSPGSEPRALHAAIERLCGREPLHFDFGPTPVRSIAIISGAGASYLEQAIAAGADAFLTGEPAERVMAIAKEAGVHFIAAGHYATETFGIRQLGAHLAERFGLEHVFIDIPNPI
ncbi:MAG TPA: Nif3-like dinuclear metal center hexameric protein [Solirubrobacteraceae bacterium]|nr:Nif3-like dinuclear metal center hexameric protein [Solirubrobacteraceae bacterium]